MLTDGRGADLLVHRARTADWDGRWLLIYGADPGERPAGAARAADPAQLGRVRVARRRPCGSARTRTGRPRRSGCCGKPAIDGRRARVRGHAGPGLGDERMMVAAAWDLAAVEDQYEPVHRGVRPATAEPSPRVRPPGAVGRLGRSSWCTPGGGSRLWSTRRCRANCCPPAGAGWRRPGCSRTGISSWSGDARLAVEAAQRPGLSSAAPADRSAASAAGTNRSQAFAANDLTG